MSGLDPIARINLKDQLVKYKNNGNSVFFSSHVLSDVDEICDRVAILDKSKLIFVGKPSEFKKIHKEKPLKKPLLMLSQLNFY